MKQHHLDNGPVDQRRCNSFPEPDFYVDIRKMRPNFRAKIYHTFHRKNTIFVFKCDSCGVTFLRPRAKVDPERATNDYKHVCPNCDTKRFAQKVGVKMRKVYKLDASSTKTL